MEKQLIEGGMVENLPTEYITYAYLLAAVIIGWLAYSSFRMLSRARAALKRAEGQEAP